MSHQPLRFRSATPAGPAAGHPRAGLSLLEVLVAGGILVVGLSSVAALLPAAGLRLSQASQEDRAGIMAANARAEVANRGLAAAVVFADANRACAIGQVATALVSNTSGTGWQTTTGTASAVLAQRIDARRGFVLEDELVYRPPTAADTPLNTFVNSGTGPREYKEAISWGATLVPDAFPAAAGGGATLGIAVFKKPGTCQALTLTGTTGAARYTTGAANGIADEATRKRFLAGCTHVLALTNPPQWRRIQASWTMPGPIASGTEQAESRQSYVVLDPPLSSGSTLTVVGFEHLIRVDQHRVTLE